MEQYKDFDNEVTGKLREVDTTLRTHGARIECNESSIKEHSKEIQALRESDIVQNGLLKQLVEITVGIRKDAKAFFFGTFGTLVAFIIWYIQQIGG